MSSISIERAAGSARSVSAWSSTTVLSLMLVACGGGGGGNSDPPATQTPPPVVTPTNVAPVVDAGTTGTVTLPDDTLSWSGKATDDNLPSGAALSYTWEFVSGPAGPNNSPGATLTSTNTADTSARFAGGPGDYVFNLKVSDTALTGTGTKHVTVAANTRNYPAASSAGVSGWVEVTPASEKLDSTQLDVARDYSQAAGGTTDTDSGYIIRNGHLVYKWGSETQLYEMKSTSKSMGGLALLLALDEQKLALADKASAKLTVFGTDPVVDPNGITGLSDITVLQLATHTSGLSKSDSPPLTLKFAPGTTWSYSDQGLNWLADVLTQTYAQDLNALMFARVYTNLGIGTGDLSWRTNAFRSATLAVNGTPIARRELASGINANVNAMARVGLLMLNKGVWNNQSILSNAIVAKAHTPPPEVANAQINDPTNYPGATANYGMLWWTNAGGQMADVPKDAYWAWGLHETFIIIVPSLDLVVVRAGTSGWHKDAGGVVQPEAWNADYGVLAPFLTPIVKSVTP
jgi:CubicO group peptidase (beta-lactamase class C family)